jgi:hypothetical protein
MGARPSRYKSMAVTVYSPTYTQMAHFVANRCHTPNSMSYYLCLCGGGGGEFTRTEASEPSDRQDQEA